MQYTIIIKSNQKPEQKQQQVYVVMKYKKKVANLKAAQAWWDKQDNKFKDSTTRPGSIKQRVVTGDPSNYR